MEAVGRETGVNTEELYDWNEPSLYLSVIRKASVSTN